MGPSQRCTSEKLVHGCPGPMITLGANLGSMGEAAGVCLLGLDLGQQKKVAPWPPLSQMLKTSLFYTIMIGDNVR